MYFEDSAGIFISWQSSIFLGRDRGGRNKGLTSEVARLRVLIFLSGNRGGRDGGLTSVAVRL